MVKQSDPHDLGDLNGTTLTLPELLARFGFRIRNYESVPVIAAALADAGLITVPPFTKCGRTTPIKITATDTPEDSASPEDDDTILQDSEPEPDLGLWQGLTVGDLASKVVSVSSTQTLARALTLMRTERYSQIPVLDGTSDLKGVVTWDSVARLRDKPALEQNLVNAMDPKPPTAETHSDLFLRLPEICAHGYLLIRDNSGQLTGIVTTADVTERFHSMALPFFLVGEIETLIRKCLGDRISTEAIKAVQGKNGSGDIKKMMFGGYVTLLSPAPDSPTLDARAEANWKSLNWPTVDRTYFVDRLREVKGIRNSIAHFDSEPPSDAQLTKLRQFKSLLEQLA